LASKDSNGLSDPFLKVLMMGCKAKKGFEQKSTVIEKTLNPRWDYVFEPFPYDSEDYSALKVAVLDKDVLKAADFMGTVCIPIFNIKEAGGTVDGWYHLHTDESGESVSGSIHLLLEIKTQHQLDEEKRLADEEKKRAEEEKKHKVEEERKKAEEEKKHKAEEEKRKKEEERKKAEEEKKLKAEEEKRKKELKKQGSKLMPTSVPPPIVAAPEPAPVTTMPVIPTFVAERIGNASCVFEFVAQSDTELSMQPGDDITVSSQDDPNWWYGTNNITQLSGYFPSNGYVQFN